MNNIDYYEPQEDLTEGNLMFYSKNYNTFEEWFELLRNKQRYNILYWLC